MSLRKKIIEDNELKKTKTTQFLVPLLGYPLEYYTDCFIGAYLDIKDEPIITCIFENKDYELLKIHLVRLENNHNFIEKLIDEDEIIYKFSIDPCIKLDFDAFISGKYSELSNIVKRILEKEYGKTTILSHKASMFDVLYPTPKKRKMIADYLGVEIDDIIEVLDKPDLDYEKYRTIEQFKEKYGVK